MGTQRRGCAFVNAYAELGDSDHPAVPVIRAEKAWMRALFDTLTGDAAVGGPRCTCSTRGRWSSSPPGPTRSAAAEARRAVEVAMAT